MINEPFPADIIITVADFRASGWKGIVQTAASRCCTDYSRVLFTQARECLASGQVTIAKIFWLLASATSMVLKPETHNDPFHPQIVLADLQRSTSMEDFTETDFVFFDSIVSDIDDFVIRARIEDMLWLKGKPRNPDHARSAIDHYQQYPLDFNSLIFEGGAAWRRATLLARLLKESPRLDAISQALVNYFLAIGFDEKYFALRFAELLAINTYDDVTNKQIADKLELHGKAAQAASDCRCARDYYNGAIQWHKRLRSNPDIWRITALSAESFAAEGEQRVNAAEPSYTSAAHFYEGAVQTYRMIPTSERIAYNADVRIDEIFIKMTDARTLATEEIKSVELPGFDISKLVDESQRSVSNKSVFEALYTLSNLSSGIDVNQLRASAAQSIQHYPLHHFFPSACLTRDGRVAAKSSGINFGDTESEEYNSILWREMIRTYTMHINLAVDGIILPALRIIRTEHQVTEAMVAQFCDQAHAIPLGRERLWAQGLFWGFEYEFNITLHLLIPQIEHFIRMLMKSRDIRTTTLNSVGIETENGLSTLLEKQDALKTILGENLLFEFQALLADPVGPNLRNEVAHGLWEADGRLDNYSIYFWRLCLRLVMNSIKLT